MEDIVKVLIQAIAAQQEAQIVTRLQSRRLQETNQLYHNWRYHEGKAPKSQLFDLAHLAQRWLRQEIHQPEKILEVLVTDQYMRGLLLALCAWVIAVTDVPERAREFGVFH
uniref:SCAN box domain-containing protein n=1 Tax=Pelusios castaneus TaxID=367368 RepID=A0A8C8S261_9SAUR